MSNDFGGKKRSELPDEVFGIPQERKYPMPDEKHTRSAIKLFNHVDPKYEEQLAKAVIKNMKKYNIDGSVVGPNNRLRKYLPKDMIKENYIYETTIQDLDYQSNNKRFYDRTTVIDAINESNLFLKDKIITDNKLHDISAVIHSLESNQRKEFENMQIKNVYFYDIKYVNRIPVGFVLLRIKRIKNNEYFGTISIAVSPNYRHKGIATELLKKAISAYKKEKKITTLEWWAANDNTASNELCKKNGFVLYKSGDDGYNRYVYKEYTDIQESSRTSDFSYSGIKTSAEKSEFKRNFREVFKEDPTESSINNMQMIKYKESLVGYIGFSRYTIDKKKYLGIGNFMIIKKYQHRGIGSKVISDIIDKYKDRYDEIYCYVDENNTNAISFYKKIAKVDTENLTRYGYYVTLYKKKSIGESMMIEGYLKSDKDIYYNKDKFDSGEINLCFITGLSGSGKSTIGRGMSSKDVEHYEIDDVILNVNFTMENFKEYGDLIYSFFKGPGKRFKLIKDDDEYNNKVFKEAGVYEREITKAFVKHAISYAKSHKNKKYVCDGIWIFMFIKPETLKDCAVYIKGTSSAKSAIRAMTRDIKNDIKDGYNTGIINAFKRYIRRIKEDIQYARENQKELKSFRFYFEKQLTNESYIEERYSYSILKTFKEIDDFKYHMNDIFGEDPTHESIRAAKMIKYDGNLIGYIRFSNYTVDDKNYLWLGNFLIIEKYQRKGHGSGIIHDIINKNKDKYDEIYCYVDKNNIDAIKFYNTIAINSYPTQVGYYVCLYKKKSIGESAITEGLFNKRTSDDDMEKLANTIITTIEPIVMTQTNKTKARNVGLVLKCSLENIDKNTVCVLILDGPQDKRDTDDARSILENIQYRIGNKLYPMVTKITMGDEDEGCLYFTINTRSVKNIGETYMNDNTLQEETRIEDNKLPKHIYHISYINHDGETFEPRTYDNDNVKNGMERKVKRVCFSDSITRALYSIFPNGAYDADFYVHVPNSDCKVYKTTSDDIYDADITHELWIKEPVQMKCIGKIHVNGVSDKTHTIDVDKDKAGYGKKKYHETRWNWVEKYEKDETLYESCISEDDDMINEGGYIFTIKILPIALKSMFRTNQYDYKWVREEYLPKIVNKCSTVEEVAYLRRDANSAIGQLEAIKINIKGILDNDEKIISRLSPSFIKKVQQGKVTVKDVDEHIRFLKGPYKKMLNDKYKEIKNKSVKESSISEYGATAGTMVGSNQPDSVYIVNYMQNNVFSGYKEPRFGICKKGMKDLHVLGDKDKKLHHVSDRDKFKEEASDIKVYRYRGKPKHTFYDIIENTTDNDKDIYKLITGRDIENRKDIDLDEEFVREECFWDELDAIKSCTEATILDQAEDLHEIPILTETVQGRPYNYYRDINGVFVQNEITKIRSKSYDSIDDIPLSEIDIIKRGYLV